MQRGFTLLEVMVAVAILGLALTAILSAQAGAFSAAAHARNLSLATGLARCKMSELEEHLLRDGYQELDELDTGPCCEGDETPNVRCSWKIEKPELPQPKYGELDLDTNIGNADLGALGVLSQSEQGQPVFDADAGTAAVAQTLASAGGLAAGADAAGVGGIAQMVMSMVYPDLKNIFEASTRRVTVTLSWTEGSKEYSLDVSEWVTNPQQSGLAGGAQGDAVDQALDAADAAQGAAPSSSTKKPKAGGPSPFTPKTPRK
jgi:general secretion pathway protein I